MNFTERDLQWPELVNARELGGLVTRSGSVVKRGAFVRTDGLHNLNSAGFAALRAHGVKVVLDLRTTAELERLPNPLRNTPEVKFINVSLLGEPGEAQWVRDSDLPPHKEWSLMMLEQAKHRFVDAFRAIAWAPRDGAVLFHCHAGKDRTGLMADILLSLVGVPDETIVEDYVLTNDRMEVTRESFLLTVSDATQRDDIRSRWIVFPETAHAVLDHLRVRYGGARGYLQQIGLSGAEINAIAARMIGT
jgi:protein tyrosine/serine phosphatase